MDTISLVRIGLCILNGMDFFCVLLNSTCVVNLYANYYNIVGGRTDIFLENKLSSIHLLIDFGISIVNAIKQSLLWFQIDLTGDGIPE